MRARLRCACNAPNAATREARGSLRKARVRRPLFQLILACTQHLRHHRVEVEAADLLTLWKLFETRQELCRESLCRNQEKHVVDLPLTVQFRISPHAFERVCFDIEN